MRRASCFYPTRISGLYRLALARSRLKGEKDAAEILGVKSTRTASRYVKTLEWVLQRVDDLRSLDDFRESLANAIMREFRLAEAVGALTRSSVPLTPGSLSAALASLGVEVTTTEARALARWLVELNLVRERRVPVLTTSLEEAVLEDVRSRGAVTYGTLARVYGDGVRDILVSLWKRGLVRIPVLEPYRDVLESAEDLDRLPPGLRGRVFSTWQDRVTGETYCELVIPSRAKISARWEL
ncbi:MAG: hypothetical protein QI223_06775 [Candidatus Korarchaeota archaeon]|nr:hypothetical protein [Candidatus Korarchaeota archaeon]